MKTGICDIAFLPLRSEAKDSSEMVSQILFGETFDILEVNDNWAFVSNHFDHYKGWIPTKMIHLLEKTQYEIIKESSQTILNLHSVIAENEDTEKNIYLPAGSVLRNLKGSKFELLNNIYNLKFPLKTAEKSKSKLIIETAFNLLNTPYLWGGRNAFGIDCSGLVQLCYRVAGISLSRDAYQQAEQGASVTIFNITPADVAFFKNDQEKIVHTGIILENGKIIHASGKVRIDILDEQGIIHHETGKYTHRLATIKRLI